MLESLERLENAFTDFLAANELTPLRMSQCYNGRLLDLRSRIDAVKSIIDQELMTLAREENETEAIQQLKPPLGVLGSDLDKQENKDRSLSKHQSEAKTVYTVHYPP